MMIEKAKGIARRIALHLTGDEKDAINSLISYRKTFCPYGVTISQCQRDTDCVDCERKQRYRWHDLRKNPEDLPPKKYQSYLAYTDLYKYEVVDYYGEVSGEPVWSISQYDINVIAWREIEPFEEEE